MAAPTQKLKSERYSVEYAKHNWAGLAPWPFEEGSPVPTASPRREPSSLSQPSAAPNFFASRVRDPLGAARCGVIPSVGWARRRTAPPNAYVEAVTHARAGAQ